MEYIDLGLPSGTLWANCNHEEYLNYNDSLTIGVLPTINQWEELIKYCTWIWTRQNGVRGYKVTCMKNDASIFLPFSGYRNNIGLHSVNEFGYYWSSTLCTDLFQTTYYVSFGTDFINKEHITWYYKFSIRLIKNV